MRKQLAGRQQGSLTKPGGASYGYWIKIEAKR